jgi:hypothetical protein
MEHDGSFGIGSGFDAGAAPVMVDRVGIPKANTQQLLPQKYWCTHSRHYKELEHIQFQLDQFQGQGNAAGLISSGLIGMAPVWAPSAARSHQLRIPHQNNASVFVLAVTANDWCRWHYMLGGSLSGHSIVESHWNLLDRMAISSTGSPVTRSHHQLRIPHQRQCIRFRTCSHRRRLVQDGTTGRIPFRTSDCRSHWNHS